MTMRVRVRWNDQSVLAYVDREGAVFIWNESQGRYVVCNDLTPAQVVTVQRRYGVRARLAAGKHLDAIKWEPSMGMSDAELGLGDSWGGIPNSIIPQGEWSKLCEQAVRTLAQGRIDAIQARESKAVQLRNEAVRGQ